MAHKKAGGSSRNGRDSPGQRLGVKRFAGQKVRAGKHPGPPARVRASIRETMSEWAGTIPFSQRSTGS